MGALICSHCKKLGHLVGKCRQKEKVPQVYRPKVPQVEEPIVEPLQAEEALVIPPQAQEALVISPQGEVVATLGQKKEALQEVHTPASILEGGAFKHFKSKHKVNGGLPLALHQDSIENIFSIITDSSNSLILVALFKDENPIDTRDGILVGMILDS
ncbi:hypothetical protein vseg_019709 [Gypsophila vaccaria]